MKCSWQRRWMTNQESMASHTYDGSFLENNWDWVFLCARLCVQISWLSPEHLVLEVCTFSSPVRYHWHGIPQLTCDSPLLDKKYSKLSCRNKYHGVAQIYVQLLIGLLSGGVDSIDYFWMVSPCKYGCNFVHILRPNLLGVLVIIHLGLISLHSSVESHLIGWTPYSYYCIYYYPTSTNKRTLSTKNIT